MINEPLVTILIPVYNGGKYLDLTIRKLLEQTYQNIEIIISDNNSQDDTKNICSKFSKLDNRITYYKQDTNIGMIKNELFLTQKIKGKYFCWMPAGDFSNKDFIKYGVKYLDSNDDTISCFGEAICFDNQMNEFKKFGITEQFLGNLQNRIKNFFNVQIHDHLLYGLHRSKVAQIIKPELGYIGPEVLQLFNILLLGKYKGIKEMQFYKHYSNSKKLSRDLNEKTILYNVKLNLTSKYGIHLLIIKKIFKNFNYFVSIYLISKFVIKRFMYRFKLIKIVYEPPEL